VVIPNTPIILAPMEFTLITRNAPIKIAMIAIKNARIFMTASGSNLCGKKVSANDIGPPKAVNEMIKLAKRASDSMDQEYLMLNACINSKRTKNFS